MNVEVTDARSGAGGRLELRVEFDRESLRLSETPFGIVIGFGDWPIVGEFGGPGLPGKLLRVALPPFCRPSVFEAEAAEPELVAEGAQLVAPLQRPRAVVPPSPGEERQTGRARGEVGLEGRQGIERFPAPPTTLPRPELYEREIETPRPSARLIGVEHCGPVSTALVELSPLRLNRAGELEFVRALRIVVAYEPSDRQHTSSKEGLGENRVPFTSRTQARRLVELVRAQVVNPSEVWDFSGLLPQLEAGVDYLVVTDDHTWDAATIARTAPAAGSIVAEFRRLVEWKARRGLRARLVTISDIADGVYGDFRTNARDLQEVIRNFLKWAHRSWGVAWVLLGGDVAIIPARQVAGACLGEVGIRSSDPPDYGWACWTGTYLKMHGVSKYFLWFSGSIAAPGNLLVRLDNGLRIPYDASGTSGPVSRGWYFTDATYGERSTSPTSYVRVNGPAAEVNADLQWIYPENLIPTDLYYASLVGPKYDVSDRHDWDLLDNGVYGQQGSGDLDGSVYGYALGAGVVDLDGVEYAATVSVGRAPVDSGAQAAVFVNKVIAYEQFRRPDGTLLELDWPRRVLFVSADFGQNRTVLWPSAASPPGPYEFHHDAGAGTTLVHLDGVPSDLSWRLSAYVDSSNVVELPYDADASTTGRGWHFTRSATDLSASEIGVTIAGAVIRFRCLQLGSSFEARSRRLRRRGTSSSWPSRTRRCPSWRGYACSYEKMSPRSICHRDSTRTSSTCCQPRRRPRPSST